MAAWATMAGSWPGQLTVAANFATSSCTAGLQHRHQQRQHQQSAVLPGHWLAPPPTLGRVVALPGERYSRLSPQPYDRRCLSAIRRPLPRNALLPCPGTPTNGTPADRKPFALGAHASARRIPSSIIAAGYGFAPFSWIMMLSIMPRSVAGFFILTGSMVSTTRRLATASA